MQHPLLQKAIFRGEYSMVCVKIIVVSARVCIYKSIENKMLECWTHRGDEKFHRPLDFRRTQWSFQPTMKIGITACSLDCLAVKRYINMYYVAFIYFSLSS